VTERRFKTAISRLGSRTGIVVPFDPDEVWGAKERHYVAGSVNGCGFRGRIESDGIDFFLSLGPAWRRDNALDEGARVDVVLSPEGPQSERLARDIATALDAKPGAKAFFDGLASFYRKNFVRWIESAKRPETRAARVKEMVKLLEAGKREK
jgi:bacteriocin resistance YdeI/OmpD-like protein/uncharacterized protein DUF1905